MVRRYSAFLVRLWRRDDGSQRIEVEHIQAGTRTVVASPDEAITWLTEHADDLVAPSAARRDTTADPETPS